MGAEKNYEQKTEMDAELCQFYNNYNNWQAECVKSIQPNVFKMVRAYCVILRQ